MNGSLVKADPFLITGPAVISFSGGRTSAYMLWHILQAHNGTLPADVVVCFANTGEESAATLDFIRDCAAAWNVLIVWLEFRHGYAPGKTRRHRWAEVVSHNSASRHGEPFDMLLESKGIVPDRSRRFCTQELKVLTILRWIVATYGWRRWTNVIGFRSDESVRVIERRAVEAAQPSKMASVFPLADAGVQVLDVMQFWRAQPFDLRLDRDGDGGNCGSMCFMMSAEQLGRMFIKDPKRAARWVSREKRCGTKTMAPSRSYASVGNTALNQGVLAWDDASPCSQGCGL